MPAFDQVRIGDTTLTELVPTEYRADLVLLLEGADGATPEAALVVEAQLGRNPDKRWSWPVYLTSLRARLRCDVALHGRDLRRGQSPDGRGRRSPRAIQAGSSFHSCSGRRRFRWSREQAVAERSPELAVLSVMLHGRGGDALRSRRIGDRGGREPR